MRLLLSLIPAMVVSAVVTSGADAAVGLCKAHTVADVHEARTEIEARRGAIANWYRLALIHGPEYTRWQIAWNHKLSCARGAGGYRCQAEGHPCTIVQVPPDNLKVLRRGPNMNADMDASVALGAGSVRPSDL